MRLPLRIRHSLLLAMLLTPAFQAPAIEGLSITVQCPNVVLSWPSGTNGETYMIRYRPTLDPSTPWTNLADFYPASGGSFTTFVHSNISPCPPAPGTKTKTPPNPPPPGASSAMTTASVQTTTTTASGPLVMPLRGPAVLVPLALYPPGYNLSGFMIVDPATGAKVSGNGYVVKPQPAGAGGSPVGASDPGYYEVVQDGVKLYGLSDGQTISGVWEFPVELATQDGQLQTVNFVLDDAAPLTPHLAPFEAPVPYVFLDTTQITNGTHSLTVHAEWLGSDGWTTYEADSIPATVNVQNTISFPNWVGMFGDVGNTLEVYAQSSVFPATWYLDIYDSATNYIGTLSGNLTNTPDIDVVWDGTGPDGTVHTDNTFPMLLTVVAPNGASVSATVPPIYRVTDPWPGPGNWVVANLQAWNGFTGANLLDTEADGWAQGATTLGLSCQPYAVDPNNGTQISFRIPSTNTVYGNPSAAPLAWSRFQAAIFDNTSQNPRNLFYLGHASGTGIGEGGPFGITCTAIGTALNTTTGTTNTPHRYRFVFLDGCSTANGALCLDFGIPKGIMKEIQFQNKSLRPCAFLGWKKPADIGFGNYVFTSHVKFVQYIQTYWALDNLGIQHAITTAGEQPDVFGVNAAGLTVYGDPDLGPNTFNR